MTVSDAGRGHSPVSSKSGTRVCPGPRRPGCVTVGWYSSPFVFGVRVGHLIVIYSFNLSVAIEPSRPRQQFENPTADILPFCACSFNPVTVNGISVVLL